MKENTTTITLVDLNGNNLEPKEIEVDSRTEFFGVILGAAATEVGANESMVVIPRFSDELTPGNFTLDETSIIEVNVDGPFRLVQLSYDGPEGVPLPQLQFTFISQTLIQIASKTIDLDAINNPLTVMSMSTGLEV